MNTVLLVVLGFVLASAAALLVLVQTPDVVAGTDATIANIQEQQQHDLEMVNRMMQQP